MPAPAEFIMWACAWFAMSLATLGAFNVAKTIITRRAARQWRDQQRRNQ